MAEQGRRHQFPVADMAGKQNRLSTGGNRAFDMFDAGEFQIVDEIFEIGIFGKHAAQIIPHAVENEFVIFLRQIRQRHFQMSEGAFVRA